MFRRFSLFFVAIFFGNNLFSQVIPKEGKIVTIENFQSKYVDSRNIDIWLPENYNPSEKYSVIYMHDGQMLFDSSQTWNRQEWRVDETLSELIHEKKVKPCIIVGIHNHPKLRISEYFPDKIAANIDTKFKNDLYAQYSGGKEAFGDNYLKFIVEELKPEIEKRFSVYTDAKHNSIAGSSMGALISLYALCEYPDVFGGSACLSTAWLSFLKPNEEVPVACFRYLKDRLPASHNHKIYSDYGTAESDEMYTAVQTFFDNLVRTHGYTPATFQSPVFENAEHNEKSWANRLHEPFTFLLNAPQFQKPTIGKCDYYPMFQSKYVSARNIEVWLPDNYDTQKKYDVLYMHDGQMLFDSALTWNKQAWFADLAANRAMKTGKSHEFIIVGIWNDTKNRHADYFPQKPFETLSDSAKQKVTDQLKKATRITSEFRPVSDNYLKFIVEELKPFIDTHYSTARDREHTFTAGSSMGGLISMYAVCEYPEIFGGAACLSTHWTGVFKPENNPVPDAFFAYLEKHIPSPETHRFYFDHGTETLDALYPELQKRANRIFKEKGYTSKNFESKVFKGENHSENAWNKRLNVPFEFLFTK